MKHTSLDIFNLLNTIYITKVNNKITNQMKQNNNDNSDLVSLVVHELKTPITTIKEAISLLSDINYLRLDTKSKKIILIAQEEVNRLVRMVNNLLKVAEIEAGKMQLKKETCQIEKIINQVVDVHSFTIQRKEMRINITYLPRTPMIKIDSDRMFDAISNLIDNALKFTPERGTISIQTKIIEPGDIDYAKQHLNPRKRYLKTTISDTGPGIPKQDLKHIFKKFTRITKLTPVKGIGLGLTITKSIIELHHGKIWAMNGKNKGAIFHFALPI